MLDVMDATIDVNLARVRDILATLGRMRSSSYARSQQSSISNIGGLQ